MFWHRLPIVQAADADARSSSGALSCLVLALCIYPQSPHEGFELCTIPTIHARCGGFSCGTTRESRFRSEQEQRVVREGKLSELVLI